MAVYFIVDDQSPELDYLCPVTKETVTGAYFNDTWTTTASDQCQDGWFQYTFQGTGVEVMAFSSMLQNHSAKIDDSPWITQNTRGAFQSPPLADGLHTLTYAPLALETPVFDYLVVEAGPSTLLKDRTIVIDDMDNGVRYNGNWFTDIPAPTAVDFSTASFRNTTHWSTREGDSFQYSFSGTSLALYGSFSNISAEHQFSVTYYVDGSPNVASIPNGTLDGMPMTHLFSTTSLPAGNHTLLVNITQISPPLAFGFDFLTYNASFSSLATMPGYRVSPPQKQHHIGAIVGGILGGLVFLSAIFAVVLVLLRRRKRIQRLKNARKGDYWSVIDNDPPTTNPVEYCKELVRKHDYEGFLISHFYPEDVKGGYFALKAFAVELAMVQEHVSNQTIGKMRMQFWRDAVKGIHEGNPPRHPIALALHQASQRAKLPAYHLKRIVDARDAELSTPTHMTTESLTAHAESTSSSLLYLLLSLLSLPSAALSHAASHLGTAQTFATLLRGLPFHAKHGRVIIPAEITAKHGVRQEDVIRYGPGAEGISDAVFEFATVANDHLITARAMMKEEGMGGKVPRRAVPIFLTGTVAVTADINLEVPIANYLGRLEKNNFDAFAPGLQGKDWKLPWQIWRGYYKREF
ncbi:hypothetical protein H0H92_006544 [Tricholoma furcatifolium]|nr:hypothetical protein H0H92_006544 [Tricholoma furcatifolium]